MASYDEYCLGSPDGSGSCKFYLSQYLPRELQDWKPQKKDYNACGTNSKLFRMKVAIEWGLTPQQFDDAEFSEQAKMTASYLADKIIEAYNYEQAKFHSEAKAKRNTRNKRMNRDAALVRNMAKPVDFRSIQR